MAADLQDFTRKIQVIMRQDAGINGDAQRIEQLGWILFLKVYDMREDDWKLDGFTSIIPEKFRWKNWAADTGKGTRTGQELLDFVNNELLPALKDLEVTPQTPRKKRIVKEVFSDVNQYMKDGTLLRKVLKEVDAVEFNTYEDIHAFGEIYESILRDLQSAGNAGEFYTPRALTDFMVGRVKPKLGERAADFAAGTCGFLVSVLKTLRDTNNIDEWDKYGRSVYGVEKKPIPYLLGITNLLLHEVDRPDLIHSNSLARNVYDYSEADKFDMILMNPPYGGTETDNIKNNFPVDMRSDETADLFLVLAMYRLKERGRAAVIMPDGFLFGTNGPKLAIKKHLLENFNLHTVVRLPAGVFSPYTSITTNILFFANGSGTRETWFYRVPLLDGDRSYSKSRPFTIDSFGECEKWWDDRREVKDSKGFDVARRVTIEELAERGYGFDYCGYPSKAEELPGANEAFRDMEREFEAVRMSMARIAGMMEGWRND
ncbi:MAG: SAM-dependent DNA methyltransferase [Synergistaceae bacterium]|nr:SAM-dependent DNA methyltransferase [Synergistaceae bacterium]